VGVFVQDFKILDRRFDEVAPRFADGIEHLLEAGLGPARQEGERIKLKVAPRGWPSALAKAVEIHPGRVRQKGDSVLVAFSWRSSGLASLFPSFDADVEVAPFGPDQTMVAVRGRYEPPGGALGAHANQLLLHRLAESTVRAFLDGMCTAIDGCTVSG
jgi:hypothetical protein